MTIRDNRVWLAALTTALGTTSLHAQSAGGDRQARQAAQSTGEQVRDRAPADSGDDDEAVELDRLEVIGQRPRIDVGDRVERGQAQTVRDLFALDPAVNIGGGTRNGQRLFGFPLSRE